MKFSQPFITILFITALLVAVISGGAAAQADVPKWNLHVSSAIGSSPVDADTISTHQTVSVAFQMTSPSNSNDIIFLPTIDSNTREKATVYLTLTHTPTGDTTSKTVQVDSGEDLNRVALSHTRPSGGSVSDGEYEIDVRVEDSSEEEVASNNVSITGFYVQETEISDSPDIGGEDNTSATIIPGGSEVQVSEIITDVTRYNDGTSEISELQDPTIPPLVENNTSVFNQGIGEFKSFASMRERGEPTLNDATVASVALDGNQYINVGTATYGIPEANHHRLVLTYSMQTVNPTNKGIGVEIVDSEGNVIDQDKRLSNLPSSSPRWLSDTVSPSVDRTKLEQLVNADEDILDEESVSIQLTDEEEAYINNNFEAYIVYRTPQAGSPGGVTIFKPFRAAIYSTDAQEVDFTYRPEHPEEDDTVQFSLTDIPDEFMTGDGSLGTVEWQIEGTTYSQTVTQDDYNELQTNPDASIDGPTHAFSTSGSHRVKVTVNPPEDAEQQRTKRVDVIGASGSLEDTPASFDVSYKVLNEINSTYGTVDVAPTKGIESLDQRARVEVTVKNSGRSQIQREVALLDTMEGEFGYTRQVRDTATITVDPQSTAKTQLSTDWPAEDYGDHKIFVVEYKDGEPQEIPNEATGQEQTAVYVEQPATLKITDIISPSAHLVYDNFTSTVELKNVGDLGTEHPASDVELIGRFGESWEGIGEIPTMAGGKVRSDTDGEVKQISFTRDGLDYSPNYPGITLSQREEVNSPWDVTVGPTTLSFHTKHYFAENNTARFKELNDDQERTVDLYRMRLLYLAENSEAPQTDYISDNYDAQEAGVVFEASGYKYTGPHYTSSNTSIANSFPNVQQDGAEWPSNAIPTTNITHFEPLTKGENNLDRNIVIKVGIDNIETARTGTARIKVVSNQKVYYPEDWGTPHPEDNRNEYKWFPQSGDGSISPEDAQTTNGYSNQVVGTASVDLSDWETLDGKGDNEPSIKVPIVIPNHPENAGMHDLKVMVRHKPDYIKTYDEGTFGQFTYTIWVSPWGDSIYLGYTNNNPGDQYEHEVFQDDAWTTVGYGDYKNSGNTTTDIDLTYKNVGGAPLQQTIDAHFWHTQPGDLVNNTSDINDHHKDIAAVRSKNDQLLTSDGVYGSTSYADPNYTWHNGFWDPGITRTLAPTGEPHSDRYQTWNFQHEFNEPGKYILHPTQYRVTDDPDRFSSSYHDVGIQNNRTQDFGPQSSFMDGEDRVTIMVWDDIKPVSRFHQQDCTDGAGTSSTGVSYDQCLDNEYNGLSSYTSDDGNYHGIVWEGGAIRFDSEQRERWTPEQANNKDVSSDNVGVDHYLWNMNPNRIGSSTSPAFVHRFDDPGYYTIENTVRDHDEYVDGAGEDNQDSSQERIYVQPDNDDPYGYIYPISSNSTVSNYPSRFNQWSNDHVWSSGDHTSGATITWNTYTDEDQVGIEDVEWSTDYGGSTIDPEGDFASVGPTESYDYSTTHGSFAQQNAGGDVYKNVEVTYEITDYAGNNDISTQSVTVVTDNTDPSSNCSTGSSGGGYYCYDEEIKTGNTSDHETGDHDGSGDPYVHEYSTSAESCVTFSERGPNGGIGFDTSTLSISGNSGNATTTRLSEETVEVCVSADANPSASASATASASCEACSNPSCGESCGSTDSDEADDDADSTVDNENSVTVSIDDYHGNNISKEIGARAKATAYDYDEDEDDCDTRKNGGTCPEPDPPGDGGDGGDTDPTPICFVGSEEVKTPTGSTPISELEEGDTVISYNEKEEELTTSTIGEVIVHDNPDYGKYPLLRLTVQLEDGTKKTTEVTANHPYIVENNPLITADDTWMDIGDVPEGSQVKTMDGSGVVVDKTVLDKQPDKIYNLHMSEGPHNYIVDGSVVHNKWAPYPF